MSKFITAVKQRVSDNIPVLQPDNLQRDPTWLISSSGNGLAFTFKINKISMTKAMLTISNLNLKTKKKGTFPFF